MPVCTQVWHLFHVLALLLMEQAPLHETRSAQGKQLLHHPAKSPSEKPTPKLVQPNQEGNTQR